MAAAAAAGLLLLARLCCRGFFPSVCRQERRASAAAAGLGAGPSHPPAACAAWLAPQCVAHLPSPPAPQALRLDAAWAPLAASMADFEARAQQLQELLADASSRSVLAELQLDFNGFYARRRQQRQRQQERQEAGQQQGEA